MNLLRILATILMLCFLMSACSSSKETGTVSSLGIEKNSGEMFALVKLDDGTEIIAWPKVFYTPPEGGSAWKLIEAGQRVEVEPVEEENENTIANWKILRVLEADK